MLNKQHLRETIFTLRKSVPYTTIRLHSQRILEKIKKLPAFQQAKTVFTYISFGKEVRTYELIDEIFKQKKICLVPRVNREKNILDVYEIKKWLDLKRGYRGILEPRKTCKKITSYATLDLAFIPCVCVDQKGCRLGYGKGFFDKLLAKFSAKTTTMCLAFDFQVVKKIPSQKHDIPVKQILSV